MSFEDRLRAFNPWGRDSRPSGEQVLVFARDKKQFNKFIGLSKHNTRDYRFVNESKYLRGININKYRVVTLKGYKDNPKFYEINSSFIARTCKSIETYVLEKHIDRLLVEEETKENIGMFSEGGIVSGGLLRPREGDVRFTVPESGHYTISTGGHTHNLTLPEGHYNVSATQPGTVQYVGTPPAPESLRGMHVDSVVMDDEGFNGSVNDLLRAAQPTEDTDRLGDNPPLRAVSRDNIYQGAIMAAPIPQETDILTLPGGEVVRSSVHLTGDNTEERYEIDGRVTYVSIDRFHQLRHQEERRIAGTRALQSF